MNPRNPLKFLFPRIDLEKDEIQRTAQYLGEDESVFSARFFEIARNSKLTELDEDIWRQLENTDSMKITKGDWESVERFAVLYKRDFQSLKNKMEAGTPIDAPIIVNHPKELHLVSGNTRLMVSRALGKVPQVLIVDLINIER